MPRLANADPSPDWGSRRVSRRERSDGRRSPDISYVSTGLTANDIVDEIVGKGTTAVGCADGGDADGGELSVLDLGDEISTVQTALRSAALSSHSPCCDR